MLRLFERGGGEEGVVGEFDGYGYWVLVVQGSLVCSLSGSVEDELKFGRVYAGSCQRLIRK